MYTLEPAREADIPRCGEILDEGRAFQRAQGFVQWTEDYPNAGTVRQDIRDQKGYVIRSGGDITAYLCIVSRRSSTVSRFLSLNRYGAYDDIP